LIPPKPAAPTVLFRNHATFDEIADGLPHVLAIMQDRLRVAKFLHLPNGLSLCEALSEKNERVRSKSASTPRFCHFRCVVNEMNPSVGPFKHQIVAACFPA
jgi:hypothetical protein